MGIQDPGVAGVALEDAVGDVADAGHEANDAAERDVHEHFVLEVGGQRGFRAGFADAEAGFVDHEGEEGVDEVADAGKGGLG